ncbi:hypothetical protein HDU87_003978 [Geranomyces variabilis]|uniref:TFIIB-type domain-containing protein n=1 Tax=Geranomyces variabilis TaxID=109894 RepID=A0AAD5TQX3_9FUNG|nr:hypothetical protein HDU87_003978 [Geranomyces variabilis]
MGIAGPAVAAAAAATSCCDSPQLDVLDDSGETICTNCGHVVTDYVLHLESESFSTELKGRLKHQRKQREDRASSDHYPKTKHPRAVGLSGDDAVVQRILGNALSGLSLSSLSEGVRHLYWRSNTESWMRDIHRRAKLAVCTWKLARSKGMVVFFPKVLEHFDIDKQHFTAALRRMHAHQPGMFPAPAPSVFKLDTFLPKLIERFSFGSIKGNELQRNAQVILKVVKRGTIDVGRHPDAIEGAAFWLAYEAAVRKKAPAAVPNQIADIIGCPRHNVTIRYAEMQQMLTLCSEAFPFLSDMRTKSTFYKALPELLLALTPEAVQRSSAPLSSVSSISTKLDKTLVNPAFAFAARKTHDVQQRILRAQLRVQQLYAGEVESAGEHTDESEIDDSDDDTDSSYGDGLGLQNTPNSSKRDRVDRRIEQALLDGHPPDQILHFKHKLRRALKFDPSLPPPMMPQ